jgi:dolichol-phosphate mannosyltransferase
MFWWKSGDNHLVDSHSDGKHHEAEAALTLLSVVIPARNEKSCIAATVEHLHLELELRKVPHEIIVVDDATTDGTAATESSAA